MNGVSRIQRQMKLLHLDEGWASITLRSLLVDIPVQQAFAHPISGAHSIWEIVLHLGTAQQLILDLLRGITRPFTPGDEWPTAEDASESAWASARQALFDADEEIRREMEDFPEAKLDDSFHEGGSSAYDTLHGYIQHAYYHAGQISTLKKSSSAEGAG
ncbi:DinB family protein [Candidatus Bipolaricaulota bacterium]